MYWLLSSWLLSGTIMAKYVLTGPGHSHLGLGGPRRCGGKWCLFAFAFVLEIRKSIFVCLPADPCIWQDGNYERIDISVLDSGWQINCFVL